MFYGATAPSPWHTTRSAGGAPWPKPSGARQAETALIYSASKCQVAITLSGLSEMEAMPSSASQRAKSGWSLGP